MNQKIQKIIENSATKAKKQKKEYLLFGRVTVFIQDPLINDFIDFGEVIETVENYIVPHLFDNIDLIYIGQFQSLIDRELEAQYENGAIFISNTLADSYDYVENIVHEMLHSLESNFGLQIYGDGKIEKEFLGKRERLFHRIKSEGYNIGGIDYLEADYQQDMDDFLYQELGYEKLNYLINGLFLNPYATTSLGEYFASGMEKYLLRGDDRRYLKTLSPALIIKIEELLDGY
tara:strand:- start:618 stop:1313 length:696 start_codon:yes stop_codon:yes gene_type:complete